MKVSSSPFDPEDVISLKKEVIVRLDACGFLKREHDDRDDVPIDCRYFDILLRTSGDPEISLAFCAKGVRVVLVFGCLASRSWSAFSGWPSGVLG